MKKAIFLLSLAFGLTAMFNLQAQTVTETFTADELGWVVPADVYTIYVEAWGGGGAGGGSTPAGALAARGGGGGGGGAFAANTINVIPGQVLDIYVAGPASGNLGADGDDGGDTYIDGFQAEIFASGGSGGTGNTGGTAAGGTGGTDGSPTEGSTTTAGDDGSDGTDAFGGSAVSGSGGDGANGGGTGGPGLTGAGTQGPGNPGVAPGGGGGGSRTSSISTNTSQTGGAGAGGEIMLVYTPEPPLAVPLSNWALLIGIGLIATFMVVRFRNIA